MREQIFHLRLPMTGYQADRSVRLIRLLQNGEPLGGRPVAAALRSIKDLDLGEGPVTAPTLLPALSKVGDQFGGYFMLFRVAPVPYDKLPAPKEICRPD